MKSITLTKSDIARFWSKVKIGSPDQCWEWISGKSKDGYGQFSIGRKAENRNVRAHRVSWIIKNGNIPGDFFICHKCDNASCVNPSHLFLGTPKDNMVDMSKKGRTGISLGENHGISVLKDFEIIEIRNRIQNGESDASISRLYKVSPTNIRKIRIGKTWSWLK